MSSAWKYCRAVVALLWAFLFTGVGAQTPAQPMAGDIVAIEGSDLRFKPVNSEPTTLRLAPDVRLSARSAGSADLLVSGAYIGTTAVPQADGTLRAVEVHVFPDSMRGTSEGHRPMEGTAGNTMTNATVSSVAGGERSQGKAAGSTMTNAAVSQVLSGASGPRLTLTYKGGEKVVTVPAGTPITKYEAADRSLLTPGTHIIAYVVHGPDGALIAQRVTVGKNGFVPPM